MQATEILKKVKEAKAVDEYLGYTIQEVAGWYLAVPNGWTGDVLEDLGALRYADELRLDAHPWSRVEPGAGLFPRLEIEKD